MKKRIVSVLLAAVLVLGLAAPAFAAQAQVTVDEAALPAGITCRRMG